MPEVIDDNVLKELARGNYSKARGRKTITILAKELLAHREAIEIADSICNALDAKWTKEGSWTGPDAIADMLDAYWEERGKEP